jgi:hypothetical protein
MEIWKDIPGYEGQYQASNLGHIRSLDRLTTQLGRCGEPYQRRKYGKLLTPKFCKSNGYYMLIMPNKKTMTVHRLVAMTFCDRPHGANEVNHKNTVKTDNRAENLEWVTSSQNRIHAYKHGRQEKSRTVLGKRAGALNALAKLNDEKVRAMLEMYKSVKSQRKVAKAFGVAKSTAQRILNGDGWKHVKHG